MVLNLYLDCLACPHLLIFFLDIHIEFVANALLIYLTLVLAYYKQVQNVTFLIQKLRCDSGTCCHQYWAWIWELFDWFKNIGSLIWRFTILHQFMLYTKVLINLWADWLMYLCICKFGTKNNNILFLMSVLLEQLLQILVPKCSQVHVNTFFIPDILARCYYSPCPTSHDAIHFPVQLNIWGILILVNQVVLVVFAVH